METILINAGAFETRAAVLIDGVLEDYQVEQVKSRGLSGNIYLGKVVRVLPGLQSAFVDIGLERTAYLHVSAVRQPDPRHPKAIENVVHQGDRILVQVIKDPIGTKGARLSMLISLPGRHLVMLPYEKHVGVSQKIGDEELRESLRAMVAAMRSPEYEGGYIVRTCADDVDEETLRADMDYLKRLWREIRSKAAGGDAPALVFQELSLAERMLRDRAGRETEFVWVDSKEAYAGLVSFTERYMPGLRPLLRLYSGGGTLFSFFKIENDVADLIKRNVALKSGGYLVIDQTEAMTTIDVNTGGYVGNRDFASTVFNTNLEATEVIARQMRLRNLGGIVMVDFIDMKSLAHRRTVLEALRKAVSGDRNTVTVSDFTELGLIEMTRKRTRDSLSHVLCVPCPLCQGRGMILSARSVAYEMMRELAKLKKEVKGARRFRVRAHPSVVELLEHEERDAFELLQTFVDGGVELEADDALSPERYAVVLG